MDKVRGIPGGTNQVYLVPGIYVVQQQSVCAAFSRVCWCGVYSLRPAACGGNGRRQPQIFLLIPLLLLLLLLLLYMVVPRYI